MAVFSADGPAETEPYLATPEDTIFRQAGLSVRGVSTLKLGFDTRVAGPVTRSWGCWVGFRFFMLVLLVTLAALTMMISAPPASATIGPPPCEPKVNELGAVAFWDNYNDYLERRLTVDESLENTGGCVPCLLRIAQVDPSDGVSLETTLPIDLGELQPAENTTIRMKFRVPPGVIRFKSRAWFICGQPAPVQEPQPVPDGQLAIEPSFAWANEGCPVTPPGEIAAPEIQSAELAIPGLPDDLSYGPRLFKATLVDENGDPVAGRNIKWSLSNNISFRILDSTDVTDEQGQVTALVTPPQYFICVVPYFSRDLTRVTAISEDGHAGSATFLYSRCAPITP